jgi:LCP family protein required for cell wall assembly
MRKPVFIVIFVLVCLILSAGAGFFAYLSSFKPDSEEVKRVEEQTDEITSKDEKINVLVMGVDAGVVGVSDEKNHKRSDTMIVVSFDPKTGYLKLLSIPRDTRVAIKGRGMDKINAANAYGGAELAINTVKNLLGIPLHYYVKVDYAGFRQLVDDLGGVELYVDRPMHYDDNAGNLHIHLDKGLQVLNGDKAEQFVRYRNYPNGDIGRIHAQQKFMDAMARMILQPATLLKLPKIANTLTSYIETNMDPNEILRFANLARSLKPDSIEMAVLPGTDTYISSISYFIADEEKLEEIVNTFFIDDWDGTRVEVLNGSGLTGVANEAASILKSEGFTIVSVSNADRFDYEKTTVIYKGDKMDDARKIAELVNGSQMQQQAVKSRGADITVIIGKDWTVK